MRLIAIRWKLRGVTLELDEKFELSLKERLNSFEREMNFKRYFDGIKFKEKFLENFFSKI